MTGTQKYHIHCPLSSRRRRPCSSLQFPLSFFYHPSVTPSSSQRNYPFLHHTNSMKVHRLLRCCTSSPFPGRNAPKLWGHIVRVSPAPSRSAMFVTYTRSLVRFVCDNKRTYGSPVCSSARIRPLPSSILFRARSPSDVLIHLIQIKRPVRRISE